MIVNVTLIKRDIYGIRENSFRKILKIANPRKFAAIRYGKRNKMNNYTLLSKRVVKLSAHHLCVLNLWTQPTSVFICVFASDCPPCRNTA